MDIEKISADCVVQHINAFLRQSTDKRVADFGEPCADCVHVKECKFSWLTKMQPIIQMSDIPIQLRYLGHFRTKRRKR